ncbi:MAG: hypothetical protein CUN53_00565 [Phototrophicales bacterium]|nr:MAG: hypothetical protein CUN53_00565 [Phototrophicales bacterium]
MDRPLDIPYHDLPLWMRRARQRIDWGALLILAFSLIAASHFIFVTDLPRTHYGEHAVYQTAAFAEAIEEGRLYSRWAAEALGGYGAPIPNFYPPGVPYFAAWVQFFFTADTVSAVRFTLIAIFCLGALALYTFVARRLGESAGVLSALLFVFSPYFSLTAPLILGDFAALAALSLFAAFLWSVDGVLNHYRPQDGFALTAASAALLLTHVEIAITAFVLTTLYALAIHLRRSVNWGSAALHLVLGTGAAACFWVPAIAEQSEVVWRAQTTFTPFPITLLSSILPVSPLDPGALLPIPNLTLGLPIIAASLLMIALTIAARKHHSVSLLALFFAGSGGCALLAAIYVDQHWLIGIASFCLAIAGGNTMRYLPPRALPMGCALILAFTLPSFTSPPAFSRILDTSPRARIAYEQLGFGTPTLPIIQPIPTTIAPLPLNRALISGFESNAVIKLQPTSPSGAVRIGLLAHRSHLDSFQITLNQPAVLDLLTARYPGWSASLNGAPVPILVDPNTGLLRLSLNSPAVGTLTVSLDSTPLRTAAWGVTWLSWLAAVLLTVRRARLYRTPDEREALILTPDQSRLIAAALIAFAAAATALSSTTALRPDPGFAIADSQPIRVRTADGIEMIAYQSNAAHLSAAEPLTVIIHWRALRPLSQNYMTTLYWYNIETGAVHRLTEPRHPANLPTRRWLTGLYVSDLYQILPPYDLPPGLYSPSVRVIPCDPVCIDDPRSFFDLTRGISLGGDLILPIILTID